MKNIFFICSRCVVLLAFNIPDGPVFGQEATRSAQKGRESFHQLPKGPMRDEIAAFYTSDGYLNLDDKEVGQKLDVIPMYKFTDSTAEFFRDETFVKIHKTGFDALNYQPTKEDSLNPDLYPLKHHPFLGTINDFPRTGIASIMVRIGLTSVSIPNHTYKLLLEPNICINDSKHNFKEYFSFVYRSHDKRRIYIYMRYGDSSASYEVVWIIEDNKLFRIKTQKKMFHNQETITFNIQWFLQPIKL